MLSTNVLCLKKRKKRSYCIADRTEYYAPSHDKVARSVGGTNMLQITEDTPPDMLTGAMDLTVHLPNSRSIKMSVERSTPMMDLLVQITTNHRLQLSGYTLQALDMAPSSDQNDKILPYKPNTPIGALDTQHIKVIPKTRVVAKPIPKNIAPGHQPFESTFRLKVHLPRNQLYVTRVSQSIHLEDIMKKVCEEKNLDPLKYEFRHPGNLDEILDPKLSLSDYQITEIYLVAKGTISLNQAFSSNDIMALRKEEERKQMHNKTGGGVFNLIFRRGKTSSGSLSSENRSISPTHSDDSRSVTPPAPQQIITTPPPPQQQQQEMGEKPKPPQRKRRPAPKPPQLDVKKETNNEKSTTTTTTITTTEVKKNSDNTGLTICHSRNSSDSSGYHEASILSDNCNTSLPRRPKSSVIAEEDVSNISRTHSQSTSNLSKMSSQSKSTSSLAFPGRKKKSAPPPPPSITTTLKPSNSTTSLETPSPIAASQTPPPVVAQEKTNGEGPVITNPKPPTRSIPKPAPRKYIAPPPSTFSFQATEHKPNILLSKIELNGDEFNLPINSENINNLILETELILNEREDKETVTEDQYNEKVETTSNKFSDRKEGEHLETINYNVHPPETSENNMLNRTETINNELTNKEKHELKVEAINYNVQPFLNLQDNESVNSEVYENNGVSYQQSDLLEQPTQPSQLNEGMQTVNSIKGDSTVRKDDDNVEIGTIVNTKSIETTDDENHFKLVDLQKQTISDIFNSELFSPPPPTSENIQPKQRVKPPAIVGVIPKPSNVEHSRTMFASFSRKSGFKIGSSLLQNQSDDESTFSSLSSCTNDQKRSTTDLSSTNSVASALNAFNFVDEIDDVDVELFSGSLSRNSKNANILLNQLHGMHDYDNEHIVKNRSVTSLRSVGSVPGFLNNSNTMKKWDNLEELNEISDGRNVWVIGDNSDTAESVVSTNSSAPAYAPPPPPEIEVKNNNYNNKEEPISLMSNEKTTPTPPINNIVQKESNNENNDLEAEWEYQLPSPPKAFRDSESPVTFTNYETETVGKDAVDSIVTSTELFEKLKAIEDNQTEKETMSDLTSVISEEEKPILSKLSLEHLEKRQSLVYNRELATSLKMKNDDDDREETKSNKSDTLSGSLRKFERTYEEVKKSSQPKEVKHVKSSLPNFKITTYDNPKQKFNIFEDDTIRSNTQDINSSKQNSTDNSRRTSRDNSSTYIRRSMENISFPNNKIPNHQEEFKKPGEYKFYKPQQQVPSRPLGYSSTLNRAESFSIDQQQAWSPSKPVTRSKSQVAINKYQEKTTKQLNEDNLSKSNSLFDVSGLQSLEVMRLIQNKLNTPNNSTEELDKVDNYQKQPEIKTEVQNSYETKPVVVERAHSFRPIVPSINMGTWSDRPKIPVNVKEDPDYKYNNTKDSVSSKLIVNTTNNDIKSSNSIEIKTNDSNTIRPENRGVSIKVNGSEPISGENTGNVVIKIGEQKSTQTYRKPFGDVNKIQRNNPRPHSIAFDSDFDMSRVPIVRSVELKKPYKDFQNGHNTSVTQIYSNNFKSNTLNNRNGHYDYTNEINSNNKTANMYRSNETLHTTKNNFVEPPPKPVFRLNSYIPNAAPVVRGFRSNSTNRLSWNQPHSISTLPAKPANPQPLNQSRRDSLIKNNIVNNNNNNNVDSNSNVNKIVPFSQVNLRRTESVNTTTNTKINIPPPVPPAIPKFNNTPSIKTVDNCNSDPKEQLLQAIRDFGGKKGLRAVKA